jgi:K+-transporting ATPase A subunit
MVGRTPEHLGKKIEPRAIKMAQTPNAMLPAVIQTPPWFEFA